MRPEPSDNIRTSELAAAADLLPELPQPPPAGVVLCHRRLARFSVRQVQPCIKGGLQGTCGYCTNHGNGSGGHGELRSKDSGPKDEHQAHAAGMLSLDDRRPRHQSGEPGRQAHARCSSVWHVQFAAPANTRLFEIRAKRSRLQHAGMGVDGSEQPQRRLAHALLRRLQYPRLLGI